MKIVFITFSWEDCRRLTDLLPEDEPLRAKFEHARDCEWFDNPSARPNPELVR